MKARIKENEKPKKKHIALKVLAGLLLVLALILAINHNLTRVIFFNIFDPPKKLQSGEWTGGKTYEKVSYSNVSPSDYVDIYVPDSEEPPRLLVLVHGGGFVFNDSQSRQAVLMYQYFRDHGFACASVNYRLAQEANFPAALEDVKAAVRFLKANAATYGYQAEDMILWGESAGGYLAAMAAVTNDQEYTSLPFIGEEDLPEPASAQVDTLIDFYGFMNLGGMEKAVEEYAALGIPAFVYRISSQWLTNALKEYGSEEIDSVETLWIGKNMEDLTEEEKESIAPYSYIARNLGSAEEGKHPLKVIVWHGDADLSVPITESEEVVASFQEALGEDLVSYRVFHNAKHAGEKLYSDQALGDLLEEIS